MMTVRRGKGSGMAQKNNMINVQPLRGIRVYGCNGKQFLYWVKCRSPFSLPGDPVIQGPSERMLSEVETPCIPGTPMEESIMVTLTYSVSISHISGRRECCIPTGGIKTQGLHFYRDSSGRLHQTTPPLCQITGQGRIYSHTNTNYGGTLCHYFHIWSNSIRNLRYFSVKVFIKTISGEK